MVNSGNPLLSIIVACASATISGIVLLYTHHNNVKQEIELHLKREQFEHKRKAYENLLKFIFDQLDFLRGLKDEINWREMQRIQRDLILSGSKDVFSSFNKFFTEFDKADEQKATKLVKDLWNSIRTDLYPEEPLPYTVLKIINPGRETIEALDILKKYEIQFLSLNIKNLESIKSMDINVVNSKTGIPLIELNKLKIMAEREIRYRELIS